MENGNLRGPADGPEIVGEWDQTDKAGRSLRIVERDAALVLESNFALPTLVLIPVNGSSISWTAFDYSKPGGPLPPDSIALYRLELADSERLLIRRPDQDSDVPVEFTRVQRRCSDLMVMDDARSTLPMRQARDPSIPQGERHAGLARRSQSRSGSAKRHGKGARGQPQGAGSDARDDLVEKVKAGQRNSKAFNELWQNFCQKEGKNIRDPNRHDTAFLADFLAFERNRSGPVGGSPDRARRRSRRRTVSRSKGPAQMNKRRRSRRRHRRRDAGRSRGRKRRQQHRRKGKGHVRGRAERKRGPKGDRTRRRKDMSQSPHRSASYSYDADLTLEELASARDAAETAKRKAERALSEEKEDAHAEVDARVDAEERRQRSEMERKIDEAEAEAKIEYDNAIRDAMREAGIVKESRIVAATRAAEDDKRRAVEAAEKHAWAECNPRILKAESRLSECTKRAEQAASDYNSAAKASGNKKRSSKQDTTTARAPCCSEDSIYSKESDSTSYSESERGMSRSRERSCRSRSRSQDRGKIQEFLRVNKLDGTNAEKGLRELPLRDQMQIIGFDGGENRLQNQSLKLPDNVRNPIAVVLSRIKKLRETRG